MRGFNFGMISRAYPDSVAARGKSSIVRHTPSARKNDRVRQVSWLPDQHARPALPDGIQWHRREHSPVTVAGAAPVYGLSVHFRAPFSSHSGNLSRPASWETGQRGASGTLGSGADD